MLLREPATRPAAAQPKPAPHSGRRQPDPKAGLSSPTIALPTCRRPGPARCR